MMDKNEPCDHTEHARRDGILVGRHFNGPDPAGYWERCEALDWRSK